MALYFKKQINAGTSLINDKVKRLSNFHDLINESAFKVTFLPFSAHFKRRYVERFWNDISKCKFSYVYDFWWNQYIRVIFIYLSMYVCIYSFINLFIIFFLNFYFFWSCEISISDDLAQASFKKKKCNVEYIQQCTFLHVCQILLFTFILWNIKRQ